MWSLMSQAIRISVFGKTYPVKERLKDFGLRWVSKAWIGTFPSEEKVELLRQFCRRHNLQYVIEKEGVTERRLSRGSRPKPRSTAALFVGEGRLQWAIEETLNVEGIRSRRQMYKSNKSKTRS